MTHGVIVLFVDTGKTSYPKSSELNNSSIAYITDKKTRSRSKQLAFQQLNAKRRSHNYTLNRPEEYDDLKRNS